MALSVKIPVFEGPLEVLLNLIEKDEIDIYDIPVARITEQYLEYLTAMEELNLEVATEFLVMASELLAIKSKMLLPKPVLPEAQVPEDSTEDPRAELVERLLEYRRFRDAALWLRQAETRQALRYERLWELSDRAFRGTGLEGVTLQQLASLMKGMLERVKRVELATIASERLTVSYMMAVIRRRIAKLVEPLSFWNMWKHRPTVREVVITFLAILELVRIRRVHVQQEELFGDILLSK